jgi:2-phosphosulfolactate phosphatase
VTHRVVQFEWGEQGARVLAASCDVLVIVDVLSFTTAVEVAVSRGAHVLPFAGRDPGQAQAFADREQAALAVDRRDITGDKPFSLSPPSLMGLASGTRLVLPSPNGSTLSTVAAECGGTLLAGCLRNAPAVAHAALCLGGTIGVVASGERWPDGSLRPAIEDLLGAGAIVSAVDVVPRSAEAELAAAAFAYARDHLARILRDCRSGQELVDAGFPQDVDVAAQLDVSSTVPIFTRGAYVRMA